MKVPNFEMPDDRTLKEYRDAMKQLEQQKIALAGISPDELRRLAEPWKDLGISQSDLEMVQRVATNSPLRSAYGAIPEPMFPPTDLSQLAVNPEVEDAWQHTMDREQARRRDEEERRDWERRRTIALEEQLAEQRASKAEAAREKPVAHSRWRTTLWVSCASMLIGALGLFLKSIGAF